GLREAPGLDIDGLACRRRQHPSPVVPVHMHHHRVVAMDHLAVEYHAIAVVVAGREGNMLSITGNPWLMRTAEGAPFPIPDVHEPLAVLPAPAAHAARLEPDIPPQLAGFACDLAVSRQHPFVLGSLHRAPECVLSVEDQRPGVESGAWRTVEKGPVNRPVDHQAALAASGIGKHRPPR